MFSNYANEETDKKIATFGSTIIAGGYLKNSMIDTDNLVVKNIYSKSGKFQTLEDGTVKGVNAVFENGNFSGNIKVTGSSIVTLSYSYDIENNGKIKSSDYSHIGSGASGYYTIDDSAPVGTILKIYFQPILSRLPSDTFSFNGGFVDINEPNPVSSYTVYKSLDCISVGRGAYVELLRVIGNNYKWMIISRTNYVGIRTY